MESATSINTVLIGDDTDLLMLIIYHTNLESHDLFFKPETKKSTKNPHIVDIKTSKRHLGPSLCTHILFIHAILGYNTTSRLYGICKGTALKKFRTSDDVREQATLFESPSASTTDIVVTGERAVVGLYNGKPGEWL